MDSITTIVIEGAGSNGVDGHYERRERFLDMNDGYFVRDCYRLLPQSFLRLSGVVLRPRCA